MRNSLLIRVAFALCMGAATLSCKVANPPGADDQTADDSSDTSPIDSDNGNVNGDGDESGDATAPGNDNSNGDGNQDATAPGNDNSNGDGNDDATAPGNDNSNGDGNDNATAPGNDNSNGDGTDESPVEEDCGNDTGNGDEIVSGPAVTEPPIDNDSVFRSLVVDPLDPNVVFCGSERNGFLRSTDGGATWVQLRSGLRHSESPENYPEIWNVAFSPTDSDILIAATTDSPGPVTGDGPSAMAGIYKTSDGGQTWFRSNCGLSNSKIGFVQYSPTDGTVVLAAVQGEAASFAEHAGEFFDGGIYRSNDGGDRWSLAEMPPGADKKNRYWIILARGNPTRYVTFGFNFEDSSLNAGFLESSNEGQTWIAFAPELKSKTITHFDVSADGETFYALERDSFVLERSLDGGQTWEPLPHVSPSPQGPIAICPSDSQVVLFASNADLQRTTDGMQTDTVVQTASAQFEWIAFAPSDPNIVYAATQGYDVYKSNDKGGTFELMANLRDEINSSP